MDEAGIDAQILSHACPGPEILEPSIAGDLTRQANDKAARQFLDHMPINPGDKEKIAHLNAERLLRL
ncbi:hypothetical protein [Streptomyces sp. NPDC051662]|uniref:hypothetical protein n=1 Tax=Streptomyces sp. NPDC051662 TaxID=3154750 RepID=UPI00341D38B0